MIKTTYGGLWTIEDTFKISTTDIYARPIYLTTENHIRGHFITCFTALLIIRMLQLKLNFELSAERIIRALNLCSCIKMTKELIKLVKNESFTDFETKTSLKGIEYVTMKTAVQEETIKDIRLIFSSFNLEEYGKYLRIDKFETKLSQITYTK